MSLYEQISEAVIKGRANDVSTLTEQALKEKLPPQDILDNALLAGMAVIGERFKRNDVFVPEVLISARALSKGTDLLKDHLQEGGAKPIGKAVIATVAGDLHDIGKNLVKLMLEGAGFQVIDLGIDVPPETIAAETKENEPDILALSALLSTTMGAQKDTIDAVKEVGYRDKVKIIVGGAPITQDFADEIGADGYAADAATAAEIAKSLV